MEERWAIVAMNWHGAPRLGIRWFWGSIGNPISSTHPIWFIIPESLSKSMLAGLLIDHKFSSMVDDFLAGKIKGEELAGEKVVKTQQV